MKKKIALLPQQQVEITGRPSDKDLSVLSKALEEGTMEALMQPRVQRLLPLRLITTQSVGGERRSAILELLPLHRGGVRQIGGKGWWLRGQSTSESDFTKRGNHKNAPIAEVVLNPLNGKDRFSVV